VETFHVKGKSGLSSIHVGESLKNLEKYLPSTQVVIVTDEKIKQYYQKDFPDVPIITIGTGEGIKTLASIETILKELIRFSCDRSSFIVGIGGGIAERVGKKLRLLGAHAQILCVTHQAQVASQAHHHLNVHKESDKNTTSTFISVLDEEQRIEELSRMMGGIKITRQTRSHAREMRKQVMTS